MAVSKLNERRHGYRFPVQLQVDLVLANGSILPVETCNISDNGLQFRCDSWLADEIEPRGIQNHPLDQILIKVVANLPVDGDSKLYAKSRIVVARRLSQDEYELGLEFISFEIDSGKVLERYVATLEVEE